MGRGTAIVGFLISFALGAFVMWGVGRTLGAPIDAEALASMKDKATDHSAASVPVVSADPVWGKADAPVTIVEISDFECPFCSKVGPTLKQIKEKYGPEKVRIVWKHNPLPFHKAARPAHEAAATVNAVAGSDAFWKFHDSAFANQKALTPENYEKWASEAGADLSKFKAAFAAKKYAAKVDEDMALAKKIGASGTPAFRINGVTLKGAQPFAKFAEVIDAQLEEAKKLVASGTKPADVYVSLTNKNLTIQPTAPDKPATPPPDDKAVWNVPVLASDPIKGPKDALVTLIAFSEFQCPFCKKVNETLKQVVTTYPNDVRVVWKDNPLGFHPRAKPAAIMARHVFKTKGSKAFWEVHDAIFDSQPKLEDADLNTIADRLGLDWSAIKAAIDGNKYGDELQASVALAAGVQARGTPHFFVNGVRLSGAQPFDAFKKAIDEQLGNARDMVSKGTPKARLYDELMKEAKGAAAGTEKKSVRLPDNPTAYKGSAGAKVSIQVFSEFQCPFCKRVDPTLKELEKEYGNKISIIWRHMPLPFHADAPLASQAAQEAFSQKGNSAFWKFHDALFEAQGTAAGLKRPNLEKIASDQGLDLTKFKEALDTGKHKSKVDADAKLGADAGINGTPAFVINGYYLSGAQPISAFRALIDRALSEVSK